MITGFVSQLTHIKIHISFPMISTSQGFPLLTVNISVNTPNVSVMYLPKPHWTMTESWTVPHSFLSVSQTLLLSSFLIQIFITFVCHPSPYNTTSMIKQLIWNFSYRPHNLGESRPVWRLSLKALECGFPKRLLCFIYISYFLSECFLTFSSGGEQECKAWTKRHHKLSAAARRQPDADPLCLQPSFSFSIPGNIPLSLPMGFL